MLTATGACAVIWRKYNYMAMVQLGLHSLCCNKCDFCLIEENHLDKIEDILVEIDRAKENI